MWNRFNLTFLVVLLAGVGGVLLFVLVVDPLGVSPISTFGTENITYNNRRQAVPQIVRSGRYDSFIVGSSTTIGLDPEWVEFSFGGRVANASIHGATPYEQSRVVGLVVQQQPKLLIHGLDATWCAPIPNQYHPWWPFPEWLYDDPRISDLGRLLNWHVIRLAIEKVQLTYGFRSPDVLANGYETRLPKEAAWNAEQARKRLYASVSDPPAPGERPAGTGRMTEMPPDLSSFPAIALLRDSARKIPGTTKHIVVFMPVHFASLPPPGSDAYTRLEICKERFAEAVRGPNTHVIDFMRRTSTTEDDSHFWDSLHVRDAVAKKLVEQINEATQRQASSDDYDYRYLSGPSGSERP